MGRNNRRRGASGNSRGQGNSKVKSKLEKAIEKATLTYKHVEPNSRTIEAKFTNSEGEKVKEQIHVWANGDTKPQLVLFCKTMVQNGDTYEMFTPTKAKSLAQTMARALIHTRGRDKWAQIMKGRNDWTQLDPNDQRDEFLKMLYKFTDKMIGRNAYEKQVEAWNEGLTYRGNKPEDHVEAAEQLFRMNEDALYLGTEGEQKSGKEVCRMLVKTLHPHAQLVAIQKGIRAQSDKDNIFQLMEKIDEELEAKDKYEENL